MSGKTYRPVAFLLAGLACLALPSVSLAISPAPLSGKITGMVTDSTGIPQMGATVLLFNRNDRLFQKEITDEKGAFAFAGLLPDLYSIRVTLASFVPAIKSRILVQPGSENALTVSLATLFSSIELVYPSPGQRASFMTDEWKWTLRTANQTRPVLRLLPNLDRDDPQHTRAALFSDTRGVLRLAAGDDGLGPGYGGADLGTAFALATSLYGGNSLQFSGNLGSGSQSGVPSAAFRTSFSRNMGAGSPEVSLTMRQLFLPGRVAQGMVSGDGSLPALRSMSVSFDDQTQLSEALSFEYGFALDSVSFLDRLNYFSPYARLSYTVDPVSRIEFTYTSGNARPELGVGSVASGNSVQAGTELQRDLSTLSLFPRVSLRGGRAKVQRGEEFELSYSRKFGSRTVEVSGYHESVTNAALTISDPTGFYASSDVLPDLFSGASVFNAGDYQTLGYTAALTQDVGEHLSATVMYGSIGALTADRGELTSANPDELRAMIRSGRRHAATVRVAATSPWSGTHMIASYQWTDHRWAAPGHFYSTQSMRPEPGLNVYVRQPIPGFSMLPWRMEATADVRNLLAQGYLPLSGPAGRRLILMQTPRVFRGGLSFIF